ncbi:MAG: DUF362 domain-containing protein [Candidatus Eisenbacteria bacterium]|uniref:DUF362 domain-containing protein n=1 Tax=Eiseniibacteriota bacterium TaxID=2212470 RepID=A0A948RYN7_UNCEI|nr:DUF362 domain-containing protein [Candidatus Eisenbacteria bacterium]MBU1948644.1 DUF362 domain-containing protein [Candidatus Eisenbacteria bacterium]MBU2692023.1 DUF362 domain-containing protein [Candidatus Eisenbacteria bacterium]
MENPAGKRSGEKSTAQKKDHFGPSRRDFLKLSAVGAIAAAGSKASARDLVELGKKAVAGTRGNVMPGRIVIYHDPEFYSGGLDQDQIAGAVHSGVQMLTGISDTAAAFESLFPGLHSGSTFAIKVNCIGPTESKWQVARGVVSGLSLMLGGTFDVSQVVIYDDNNIVNYGYNTDRFTFNGHAAVISSNNNNPSSYYVYGSHRLSQYILDCDYLISIPVLKSHTDPNNQITLALKNHYGSCSPASLCGNIPGMLTLNADQYVKPKTALVVADVIEATYNGGPGEPPQIWNTFPEMTPNTLFFSTDPTTSDYWGREYINTERASHGWAAKPCTWVELSSGSPYEIGVSDPGSMTVINYEPSDVDNPAGVVGGTFLAPNVPNPCRNGTELRFRLDEPSRVSLQIISTSGRMIRRLGGDVLPEGRHVVKWDGRDSQGRRVPAGVYFTRMEAGRIVRTRRIVVAN